MPERPPLKFPSQQNSQQNVIGGTNTFSGTPNTGQVLYTTGPSMTDSRMSGGTADVQLWTGGGRLDFLQLLGFGVSVPQAASGFPIFFYDSHNALSGGPGTNSGPKTVGILDPRGEAARQPATTGLLVTFNSGALIYTGPPYTPGTVFTSGLCVVQRSGQPGFIAGWTPVVSN